MLEGVHAEKLVRQGIQDPCHRASREGEEPSWPKDRVPRNARLKRWWFSEDDGASWRLWRRLVCGGSWTGKAGHL